MKKNRGFVFIETMVTIVILSAALLSLYSLFNALVIREKRRHYYDDPIYIYRANYITNMFIEKYLAAGSNSSTSILNDESYNYALAADLLAIDGEHSSHIRSISCDNDFFDNINNSKSECETFFNDNQIYKMYVASYDLSFLKACSNKKLKEGLDLNDTCTEYEYMSSQAKQYIKTLKYIKGANGYYFIYEFNDNGRGGACTSDDCIHQFAAVKRGTVNDVDVYGGASGSIVVKNGTISIPDDEVADNYNIGTFTNLVGNGSFEDQSQTNFSLENLSYAYSNTEQSNGSSSLKITNTSNNSAGYLIFDDDIATNSSSDYYCRYSSKSKTQTSLYFPYSVRKKLANNATGTTWNTISGILTKPEYESSNVAIGLSYDSSSNATAYIDDLMCLNVNDVFTGDSYPSESWFNQISYFDGSINVGYKVTPDGGSASFIVNPDAGFSMSDISIDCNDGSDGATVIGNRIYMNNISGNAVCTIDFSPENNDNRNYTITYDLDGGTMSNSNPAEYNRNSPAIILREPTKSGYRFVGWSGGKNLYNPSDAGATNGGIKMVGDSIIFDHSLVPDNAISYLGIQTNYNNTNYNYPFQVSASSAFGRKTGTFVKDSTFNNVYFKMNSHSKDPVIDLSNITFKDSTKYTVSFNVIEFNSKRNYAKVNNFQIEEGETATAYERYVVREKNVTIPRGSTGNRHYVANWIPIQDSKTYSLNLHLNGGTIYGKTSVNEITVLNNEAFDIPIPEKSGYLFNGWKELVGTFNDEEFEHVKVYNNNSNGAVIKKLVNKSLDNPLSATTKELVISNTASGPTKPGLGGFYYRFDAKPNQTYIHIFVAKLPEGVYFHNANNNIGTGGSTKWITSQAGTGKFQTYAYIVNTGSGTLSANTFGHVYMSVSKTNTWNNGAANSIEELAGIYTSAFIASSEIYNITNSVIKNNLNNGEGNIDLHAQWVAPKTLTINPNGGTYKNDTTNYTTKGVPGGVERLSNYLEKPGYIFSGWDVSGSGSVDYFDEFNMSTATSYKVMNFNSASSALPKVYNNSSGGAVTIGMVNDSQSNGYALKVTTNGSASPGTGGIYADLYPNDANKIIVVAINAKIPTGYKLQNGGLGNMYSGVGSNYAPGYNDNVGTGEFKTYYIPIYMGKTGFFQNCVYLHLTGSNNTSVTWYVKSFGVYTFDKKDLISKFNFGDGDTTLTAKWSTGGAGIIFNPNGGSFNTNYVACWKNSYYVVNNVVWRFYFYNTNYGTFPGSTNYNWTPDSRVTTYSGHTFQGWYTAASGGTKIFNADGTLVPNVSGYSDSSSKWIKYDSNVTLYAHWS